MGEASALSLVARGRGPDARAARRAARGFPRPTKPSLGLSSSAAWARCSSGGLSSSSSPLPTAGRSRDPWPCGPVASRSPGLTCRVEKREMKAGGCGRCKWPGQIGKAGGLEVRHQEELTGSSAREMGEGRGVPLPLHFNFDKRQTTQRLWPRLDLCCKVSPASLPASSASQLYFGGEPTDLHPGRCPQGIPVLQRWRLRLREAR